MNGQPYFLALFILLEFACASRLERGCSRPDQYRGKSVPEILSEANATFRNDKKRKAVVYSVYGSNDLYIKGLYENIKMVRHFYPGWDVLVYLDKGVPKEAVDKMIAEGAKVEIGEYRFAASRFFAADKEEYDLFVSRDADSRIYPREVAAVADWLREDWAILHGMRDLHGHTNPMLAGMWGARSRELREKLKEVFGSDTSMEGLYRKYRPDVSTYGDDEKFLREVVLKAVGEGAFLSHESVYCKAFEHSRGFPIPLSVGSPGIGSIIHPKN